MKVLQLVEGFNFGGAETKLLELVQHMDTSEFETTVMSLGLGNEIEEKFNQLNCRVLTFQRQHRFDLRLLRRLRNFIRDEQIDIVMTTLFYADVMGAMAGHKGGAKGVFSWETISSPKWLTPHRFWGYRYAIRRADEVISVSQATAEWLVEKRKVPRHKIRVIPYGVNLDIFKPERGSISRTDLGLAEDAFVIGQVSRLNEQKGHVYLMQAAPELIHRNPNVHILLVGDGPTRPQIETMIREHRLEHHVHLLGFRNDVAELLPLFDVFTLPSLYEGLPNVVLEAMAAGLPVVATPVDGTKEAVVDQETGLLIPTRDPQALNKALLTLIEQPQLAKSMGNAGRKHVKAHFSLENQVKQFENLYKQYALSGTKK
ncbi:MAG: glycosyltransferase [candidate division KSB1 bacterium]|nr:glycosyltransferase [candidate division KSB1 bacterium]